MWSMKHVGIIQVKRATKSRPMMRRYVTSEKNGHVREVHLLWGREERQAGNNMSRNSSDGGMLVVTDTLSVRSLLKNLNNIWKASIRRTKTNWQNIGKVVQWGESGMNQEDEGSVEQSHGNDNQIWTCRVGEKKWTKHILKTWEARQIRETECPTLIDI